MCPTISARGEQSAPDYLALNPQGFVPALELPDGTVLTQSLAIIEWLDETVPDPPLLPADPLPRARVRAFALVLAADTHPLQNLAVLLRLRCKGWEKEDVDAWAADINRSGLQVCEALLADAPGSVLLRRRGLAWPTSAWSRNSGNARRFGVDVGAYPRLLAREAACTALPAFAGAVPGSPAGRGGVAAWTPLYAMPGHLIRRAQQVSTALFAEECAGLDLTSVQFAALVAIRGTPGVDATRLSHLIAFDRSYPGRRPGTSGGERLGPPHPQPSRQAHKAAAPDAGRARRLLRRAEPAVQRVQQRLLEPLTPADRAAMLRLLTRLAAVHNDVTPVPVRAADGG